MAEHILKKSDSKWKNLDQFQTRSQVKFRLNQTILGVNLDFLHRIASFIEYENKMTLNIVIVNLDLHLIQTTIVERVKLN